MAQRLIDANMLKESVHAHDYVLKDCLNSTDKGMFTVGIMQAIDEQPTIDAVPLDGSFLKMSKGDYLIYNRHWLYEHFDMEMEIQRSAMKSMGYEPALKDAQPHWIPCNERLPEDDRSKVVTLANGNAEVGYYSNGDWWCVGDKVTLENPTVIAWMPLPESYKVKK